MHELVTGCVSGQTLSACRRQSMRRILPFWSGLERTQTGARRPLTHSTKSSRLSATMSLRNFASRRDAHFCFTSAVSLCNNRSYNNNCILHRFNGLFSRTTWVSRYQKGKTSLDLYEVKDDGVLGRSCISWTVCKQSAPRSRQITTPTPHRSISTGQMLFLAPK